MILDKETKYWIILCTSKKATIGVPNFRPEVPIWKTDFIKDTSTGRIAQVIDVNVEREYYYCNFFTYSGAIFFKNAVKVSSVEVKEFFKNNPEIKTVYS